MLLMLLLLLLLCGACCVVKSPRRSCHTTMTRQVGDQVLQSTNDMLANASAISGLLQEMGAGVADVSLLPYSTRTWLL